LTKKVVVYRSTNLITGAEPPLELNAHRRLNTNAVVVPQMKLTALARCIQVPTASNPL
jgi:hypothetical protein